MASKSIRLQTLYRKVVQNTCSRTELKEFFQQVRKSPDNSELIEAMDADWVSTSSDTANTVKAKGNEQVARILNGSSIDESSQYKTVSNRRHLLYIKERHLSNI